MDVKTLAQQVNTLASQCVRCGLCLTVCPTYQLNRLEAESPRGRIQLLAAVARDELMPDAILNQHLSQCLSCRQCEMVCPTHVPYENLLLKGRALLQQKNPRQTGLSFILKIMTYSATWRRRLFNGYRLFVKLGLLSLSTRLGLLRLFKCQRLLAYLPKPLSPTFINASPYKIAHPRGCVLLLTGCSSDVLEPQTLTDAVFLLNAWGYEVIIPKEQQCCGALHAHAGFDTHAATLAKKNTAVFLAIAQQQKLAAIIQLTTGCASTWQTYVNLPAPIIDIQRFLLDQWPTDLRLNALALSVAIHTPCSQRNSMHEKSLSQSLLSKIPELQLTHFGDTTCCGAAGDYFLKHPQLSDQLGQHVTKALKPLAVSWVVSANIGCRLQLAKQLADQKMHHRQLSHPISVLARAL